MKLAKRLKKIGIWFKGPLSEGLFAEFDIKGRFGYFDHLVIGTGESRAVAAARAISHMRDLGVSSILEDIQTHVQIQLPASAPEVEAFGQTQMYCIIALDVEREDD